MNSPTSSKLGAHPGQHPQARKPCATLPRRSCSRALTGDPTDATAFQRYGNRAIQTLRDFVVGSRDTSVCEISVST